MSQVHKVITQEKEKGGGKGGICWATGTKKKKNEIRKCQSEEKMTTKTN